MSQNELKCSIAECKARLVEIDSMDLHTLEKYATKCSNCGNWILKDNEVAQKTYQKVSLQWAEAFNEALLRR
ncbi:MAG: hypothetical protein PHN18_11245 [Sulfurospirillaceae bacterium]|jgi:hypothetical protein|nr:hypothetical protein [Sulfurospirillaceae bacterium]MDD2826419.1 hypothetical protein [Sulfurospirillaceae bacterium]